MGGERPPWGGDEGLMGGGPPPSPPILENPGYSTCICICYMYDKDDGYSTYYDDDSTSMMAMMKIR